jgi:hypothetical protein
VNTGDVEYRSAAKRVIINAAPGIHPFNLLSSKYVPNIAMPGICNQLWAFDSMNKRMPCTYFVAKFVPFMTNTICSVTR